MSARNSLTVADTTVTGASCKYSLIDAAERDKSRRMTCPSRDFTSNCYARLDNKQQLRKKRNGPQ